VQCQVINDQKSCARIEDLFRVIAHFSPDSTEGALYAKVLISSDIILFFCSCIFSFSSVHHYDKEQK